MANGYYIGISLFCFIISIISFQVGMRTNTNFNFFLGIINGTLGIINMGLAF